MRRIAFGCIVVVLAAGAAASYYRPKFLQPFFEKLDGLAHQKGQFKGDLEVRFHSTTSGDGRRVELILLLKPFGYRDANGLDWDVPAGFISDGASVPEWLWAVVGGPYSGPYRDAAVIHDYFCWKRTRKWEDVHRVFLEAALNRGTAEALAKSMYAGILLAGPRWDEPQKARMLGSGTMKAQLIPTQSTTPPSKEPAKSDREAFEDLKAWIEREKPTLEEIRKRVEEVREEQKK